MTPGFTPSSPTVTGIANQLHGQDLPGGTSQEVLNKNTGMHKTTGLNYPVAGSATAKPIETYSVHSLRGGDMEIVELGTDNSQLVEMDRNAKAIGLVGCLFLVHVPDKGETYEAWHISRMDLCHLLNQKIRAETLSFGHYGRMEVEACDVRAESWKSAVLENPGTTYLCGPNADEQAHEFFNVDTANVTRTEAGPVSVTFDLASRSFHVDKADD